MVYKDASDDEGDLDKILKSQKEDEYYDEMESDEDEFDEEIQEIDIRKGRKRQRQDSFEDDGDMDMVDDSISEDEPKRGKKGAQDDDPYGSEYDSQSDEEDEAAMRQRLVAESDEED